MHLIPLAHDSKKPLAGDDWHARISDDPAVHAEWLERGLNVGFPVEENGRVVVDFDDKKAGERFMKQYPRICTVTVETRRGVHLHFSGRTSTRKFAYGDIKGNGYTVYPPSIVDGFEYKLTLTNKGFLHPFPEKLFPHVKTVRTLTRSKIRNLDAYLAKIESIEGKNGSAGLVRAASVCRDSGLSESEATIALLRWNGLPVVRPAWQPDDIARAVTRVFKKENPHATD